MFVLHQVCAFYFPLISILFLNGVLPTILTPGAGGAGVLTGWWAFFVFLIRHKVAGHWRKDLWGKTIKLGVVLPFVFAAVPNFLFLTL